MTVEGELGDYLATAFPGMTLTHGHGTTTLTGELRDQAELQGVLQRVSDLGLTLLETKAVESNPKACPARSRSKRSNWDQAPAVPRTSTERS